MRMQRGLAGYPVKACGRRGLGGLGEWHQHAYMQVERERK